jgi:hypothetical protein
MAAGPDPGTLGDQVIGRISQGVGLFLREWEIFLFLSL